MGVWDDQGVVVTGAARGIGAAIARRLDAEGARLVLADVLDEVTEVADELGALAVIGDCAGEDGVAALVEQADSHLGGIDCWVGNAGILRGIGLDVDGTTEQDWADSWEVNVMAHVRASRLLVPRWLERGSGRMVVTASAAGLLTIPHVPTYAVTKHGAESFAEWLSMTYGHRGVAVHAICPQGVLTDMFAGPDGSTMSAVVAGSGARTPEQVAEALVDAVDEDRFLVLPHDEVAAHYAARAADTDTWLTQMQQISAQIDRESVAE